MTTPKQPATEAGRALLADYITDDESGMETMPDDIAERILAIEAEAAAGLLALREALDHLLRWPCRQATDGDCVVHGRRELRPDEICAWAEARRVLADTAPAAAEIVARIELGDAWREAEAAAGALGDTYDCGLRRLPDGSGYAWASGHLGEPPFYAEISYPGEYAETPAAALRKLARALREQPATEEAE